MVCGGKITACGEKSAEHAKRRVQPQNGEHQQKEVDEEGWIGERAIAGLDDRTCRAGDADGGEGDLQKDIHEPEAPSHRLRLLDCLMKHTESYQFDGAEDADQREEHIRRGDIVRCGREDGASAAENENERLRIYLLLALLAFALPQGLLKCGRLAVQLAHESSRSRALRHPCEAFSRRTRLNTRFSGIVGCGFCSNGPSRDRRRPYALYLPGRPLAA